MPQKHSELYSTEGLIHTFTREDGKKEVRLDPVCLSGIVLSGRVNYFEISNLLREVNDAQFGIVSRGNQTTNAWVRDATDSLPLAQRIGHDSVVIETNNMLLRCLSRMRAIDDAIKEKFGQSTSKDIRQALRENFAKLVKDSLLETDVGETPQDVPFLTSFEELFNTELLELLHHCNMTSHVETAKDAKALLQHYRNLSVMLDPTPALLTLTYDGSARVLQCETQYPITQKTATQKAALESAMDNIPTHATEEADRLFKKLLLQDDRVLPAQARKSHLVGVKNAFIVRNSLVFLAEEESVNQALARLDSSSDTLWFARSGSPVYVGSGHSKEDVQTQTRENLEQVRLAAAERLSVATDDIDLHVTCLVTDAPNENESMIVSHLRTALGGESRSRFSYVPVNIFGTACRMRLAPGLFSTAQSGPRELMGIAPGQKAWRLDSAASVFLRAMLPKEYAEGTAEKSRRPLSLVHCASGQDRTGTLVETATQRWMRETYADKGRGIDAIEAARAQGGNAAEIASHLAVGSPGMKRSTIASNLFGGRQAFSAAATAEFYRASADTNKSSPVRDVSFLSRPSETAITQFTAAKARFKGELGKYQTSRDKRVLAAQKLARLTSDIITKAQRQDCKGSAVGSLSATEVADLTTLFECVPRALEAPTDSRNNRRLLALTQQISGHSQPQWHALGEGLVIFSALILLTAAILFFIPSGGSTLLLAVGASLGLGELGIGLTMGGTALASLATGFGLYNSSGEKGLAKQVSTFLTTEPQPSAP